MIVVEFGMILTLVIFIIAAYLIGSLSFAVIVSRVMGLADPRSYGSNNPGATNVLRSGNKKAAALTLLGDAVKGWVAVFAAQQLAPLVGLSDTHFFPVFEYTIAAVALAVTIGHMWPVFFHFKGGKGVATAAGILLALNLWLGLATLAVWLFVAKGLKISSLSAIAAAIAAPFLCWYFLPVPAYIVAVIVISALLILRHKQNIIGLLSGKEGKIGDKA